MKKGVILEIGYIKLMIQPEDVEELFTLCEVLNNAQQVTRQYEDNEIVYYQSKEALHINVHFIDAWSYKKEKIADGE